MLMRLWPFGFGEVCLERRKVMESACSTQWDSCRSCGICVCGQATHLDFNIAAALWFAARGNELYLCVMLSQGVSIFFGQ